MLTFRMFLSVLGVLVTSEVVVALNLAEVPCGLRKVAPRALTRVKGGRDAYRGQFPWAASVQHRGIHFCMGAVISDQFVLTAAHCFGSRPAGQFTVVVGGHNLTATEQGRLTLPAAERILHDDYKEGSFDNDVALIRLASKLTWSDFVQPACLPDPGAGKFTGQTAAVAGWGYLDEWRQGGQRSETLQWVSLPVLSRKTCQQWYREAKKKLKIHRGQLCAGYKEGGRDSCQADSGSPLVVQAGQHFQVVGVVSAGIGCGRPLLPGVYTDVIDFSKWIQTQVTGKSA